MLAVTVLRTIGLPACIVIAFLAFYEGIPGMSRIPYLPSIPVIGELATGRVHSFAADAVKRATEDLVAEAELAAVEAQLERERELRAAADRAAFEARKRAAVAEKARQDALSALDARIAEDTGDDGAVWTEEDLQWLGR